MSTSATKSKPTRTSTRGAGGRGGKRGESSASKAKAKSASAKSKTAGTKAANKNGSKRLSPGGLDGLVVGYMKKNRGQAAGHRYVEAVEGALW